MLDSYLSWFFYVFLPDLHPLHIVYKAYSKCDDYNLPLNSRILCGEYLYLVQKLYIL